MSLNKAILIGYLGRDPEVRTMQNGNKVVNMSLATSESWKDKQTGERREKTEWHRIVIWNEKIGDVAAKFLKKGSLCCIEGQIETRKFQDKDGSDRWTTEIVVPVFGGGLRLLGGKDGVSGGDRSSNDDRRSDDNRSSGDSGSSAGGGGSGQRYDDEIPFAPEWR